MSEPIAADAVELEIFKHLLAAVAEEMGARLMRSAYSPNIKERRDFSCALFSVEGAMLAQAAHIPVHLGAMPESVAAVLRAFPAATMKPGDVYVLNDPFAGGTHLPDITLVAPCILAGETAPRFFVANRAHHADIGGVSAGSMPLAQHIDEEGLRIPPMPMDPETIEWISSSSRTPDERRGDLQAQLAAIELGQQRLGELCRRHGADHVAKRGTELLAYTERLMSATIAAIPDGQYSFGDVLDGDGYDAVNITIHCTLRVTGGCAELDFSASDDQVPGPVNAVRAITVSAVNYVFRCLGPADTPSNAGVMRPLTVRTRAGSLLDARPPAPVAAGNVETSQRIVDVVLGALAQALPERIPAASSGTMCNVALGGDDPRYDRSFAYYETVAGGAGAGPTRSGASAVHTHMTNTLNTPIEALEHSFPLRIERYSIRRASGGLGRHRGGNGLIRRYFFGAPVELTLLSERHVNAPYGLAGGNSGSPAQADLIDASGASHRLAGKCKLNASAGTCLEISTPGGGGWGNAPEQSSKKD